MPTIIPTIADIRTMNCKFAAESTDCSRSESLSTRVYVVAPLTC